MMTGVSRLASLVAISVADAGIKPRPLAQDRTAIRSAPTTVDVVPIGVIEKRLLATRPMAALAGDQSLQTRKADVLRTLAAAPFLVDTTVCRPAVDAVVSARDAAALAAASTNLGRVVRREHRRVTERALTLVCQRAGEEVGFRPLTSAVATDGTLRLLSVDQHGRAMVSEIKHGENGMPSVETEIVGLGDGTCHKLMDRFDEAMAGHGVRSDALKRQDTGGVCRLASSRAISGRAAAARQTASARRAARLRRQDRRCNVRTA
jgi:hypothetical protein